MRSEVQCSLLHRGWCEKFIPPRRTKVYPHSPLRVNCCRNDAVLSVSSSNLYLRGRLPGLLKMLEHKLFSIRSWHVMIPFFSTCQTFTLKELVVAADRGRQAGATNLGSRWSTSYLWAQWRAQLSCLVYCLCLPYLGQTSGIFPLQRPVTTSAVFSLVTVLYSDFTKLCTPLSVEDQPQTFCIPSKSKHCILSYVSWILILFLFYGFLVVFCFVLVGLLRRFLSLRPSTKKK